MAKFISKYANHVLCMIPNRVQIVDGYALPITGQQIRFNATNEYDTNDKKEIEFIRNHRLFGTEITEVEEAKTKKQAE